MIPTFQIGDRVLVQTGPSHTEGRIIGVILGGIVPEYEIEIPDAAGNPRRIRRTALLLLAVPAPPKR